MKPLPNASQHRAITKVFHWSVATLIVIDFCFALSFSQFNPGDRLYFPIAYAMHMTFGMLGLILAVPFIVRRLTWGRTRRTDDPTKDMSAVSRALAWIVHALLYAFMIVVPLTGWAILSTRKQPAVLLDSVHWPNIGFVSNLPRPQRQVIYDLVMPGHTKLAYIGMSLVGLHILAALYHHFYRRDDVLRGMLPTITTAKGDTGRTELENAD
jgi:cytochrome b561